jgi:hypothetical protein
MIDRKKLTASGAGLPTGRIVVRWLPVEALKPDKRNARVHSARQVARIADSISAFGFNVPILVDEERVVLAGHGRLLAAKRLRLKEAPAITLGHLNEAERRAFMIADNRLNELASWDEERLALELEELKSLDLDFALEATGFELSEIDLKIEAGHTPREHGRPPERPREPDRRRVKPNARGPKGSVTRAGDAWSLGPHRLDCCSRRRRLLGARRRGPAMAERDRRKRAPPSDRRDVRLGAALPALGMRRRMSGRDPDASGPATEWERGDALCSPMGYGVHTFESFPLARERGS